MCNIYNMPAKVNMLRVSSFCYSFVIVIIDATIFTLATFGDDTSSGCV